MSPRVITVDGSAVEAGLHQISIEMPFAVLNMLPNVSSETIPGSFIFWPTDNAACLTPMEGAQSIVVVVLLLVMCNPFNKEDEFCSLAKKRWWQASGRKVNCSEGVKLLLVTTVVGAVAFPKE